MVAPSTPNLKIAARSATHPSHWILKRVSVSLSTAVHISCTTQQLIGSTSCVDYACAQLPHAHFSSSGRAAAGKLTGKNLDACSRLISAIKLPRHRLQHHRVRMCPSFARRAGQNARAVWRYNLEIHFRGFHRLRDPKIWPLEVKLTDTEVALLKVIWEARRNYSKPRNLKRKKKPLAISENHSSRLALR